MQFVHIQGWQGMHNLHMHNTSCRQFSTAATQYCCTVSGTQLSSSPARLGKVSLDSVRAL